MPKPDFRMTYQNIIEYVREVGTENITLFGGHHVGGYFLQQIPEEITAMICYFLERGWTEFDNYLEIGSAAGGFTKLMSDFFTFNNVYIVDNNMLPASRIRKTLLYDLNTTEFIGDSHSSTCRRTIRKWGKKFDLVHIDGDHNYEGVADDTFLVREHLNDGAIILYHDIRGIDGVIRWYDGLVAGSMSEFTHVKSFVHPRLPRTGIGVFQFHFDPMKH